MPIRRPIHVAPLVLFALVTAAPAQPARAQSDDGCRFPFVWREALPDDHVCVTPGTRSQAADDNAHAAERVNATNHDYGPDTCGYGLVWREIRPDDHVCVTPGTRSQTASDNAEAANRRAASAATTVVQTSCCPHDLQECPVGRTWCP